MIALADVLARLKLLLVDEDLERWTTDELRLWLYDGAIAIVTRKPSANSKTAAIPLVAGTLQRIPADGIQLIDVVRNMGQYVLPTPGRAIRIIDRQTMDDYDPDWHSADPEDVIKHFTYDEQLPKQFYVTPPAMSGIAVEIAYSACPDPISNDMLNMSIEYLPALVDYIAYRALSKDDTSANATAAATRYQAFADAVGGLASVTDNITPNVRSA